MKKHSEEHFYNPDLFYDPKNPKSECVLQVSGVDFDPDAFLTESNLSQEKKIISGIIGMPDEIREKIKSEELPDKMREIIERGELSKEEFYKTFEIFDTPFLLIRISQAATFDLQLEEALLFLRTHSEELLKLCSRPNIEDVYISFMAHDSHGSERKDLPDEFYELCHKIGIQAISC